MPRNGCDNKTIISELEELFTDPICHQLLRTPILWGQHTLSKSTINHLADNHNNKCISHPYTRDIVYINKIKELPEKLIIQDLILIFLYCKSIEIDNKTLRTIFVYFINILLIQQKKLNQTNHLLNFDNQIQDLLLRNFAEILKYKKQIIKILTISLRRDISSYYKVSKPSNVHLNGILFMAVKYNNDRLVDLICSQKLEIDVSIVDKKHKTLLHWACYYGKKELVLKLISIGLDPNVQDINGQSPLYWACHNNKHEIAEILLQHNADVDVKDINGNTPIMIAYNKGYMRLAEILIENGSAGGYTVKDQHNNTLMVWFYEQTSQLSKQVTKRIEIASSKNATTNSRIAINRI